MLLTACVMWTNAVTQPTPLEYMMYLVVTTLSLLAGASVVHNIAKPDMVTSHTHSTTFIRCRAPYSPLRAHPHQSWCTVMGADTA